MNIDITNRARRWFTEVWANKDRALVAEWMAEDTRGEAAGRVIEGRDAWLREVFEPFSAAFPDMRFDVLGTVTEAEQVVVRWRMHGTPSGRFARAARLRPARTLRRHHLAALRQPGRSSRDRTASTSAPCSRPLPRAAAAAAYRSSELDAGARLRDHRAGEDWNARRRPVRANLRSTPRSGIPMSRSPPAPARLGASLPAFWPACSRSGPRRKPAPRIRAPPR
ncbi:MAG: nuclear transport factor 2 family protein [Rhodanobacteraceae bacterium]|nr:nuclear transport factor 2 family protein [Rhodanobacteraceae bacterium]